MSSIKKILIIEDNPDDIELCKRALNKCKRNTYEYRFASNEQDGMRELTDFNPDCVLLDYSLPGNNGLAVLQKIKEHCWYIPVIILTGLGSDSLAAEFIKRGAFDYISKSSINNLSLNEVMHEAITHSEKMKRKAANDLSCPKIMIVDDNQDDRERCVRALKKIEKPKYQYIELASGDNILEKFISKGMPDCLLLDYSLPGKNGIRLLQEIKLKYPFLPVIMMTGQGNEQVAVQAIKEGASDYLVKSNVTSESLNRSISTGMEKNRLEKEIVEKSRALKDSQAFLELIMQNNPDLIFVKDENFRIVQANSAFINAYPKSMQNNIIGFTTVEEYEEEAVDKFLAKDREAFERGKVEYMETIKFPDKTVRKLYTQKIKFYNAEKKAFILGIARDVTERENLIQKLSETNEDLEKFAYIASHDLKSPLRAIDNISKWLIEDLQGNLTKRNEELFDTLRGRVARMERFLNDLLAYSRAGEINDESEIINLYTLVEDLKNLLDIPEGIKIEIDDSLRLIEIPKMPIEQVIHNLIGNAVKHHDKKNGVISISSKNKGNFYEFIVKDDGPGIADKFQNKIFEMFQTLKPRDEVEGSGMGLALVKKIVNRKGGQIKVLSKENEGASFIFTWPKFRHEKPLMRA